MEALTGKKIKTMKRVKESARGIQMARGFHAEPRIGEAGLQFIEPIEQCAQQDGHGHPACSFKWGDHIHFLLGLGKNLTLYGGSRVQMELSLNLGGMAAMFDIAPLKLDCKSCGGMCEIEIPKVNGISVIPTMEDINNVAFVSEHIKSALNKANVRLPATRKQLAQMIQGAMMMVGAYNPDLFKQGTFTNKHSQVYFTADGKINIPMPACPFSMNAFKHIRAPLPAHYYLDWSEGVMDTYFTLPTHLPYGMPVDILEGYGLIRLQVNDAHRRNLLGLAGALAVNTDINDIKVDDAEQFNFQALKNL